MNFATRISNALQYVHKALFSTAIANMPLAKRQPVPHPELSEHPHDVGSAVLGERSRDYLQRRGSGLKCPLLYAFHILRNPHTTRSRQIVAEDVNVEATHLIKYLCPEK